jgi:acetamidase/formamidase
VHESVDRVFGRYRGMELRFSRERRSLSWCSRQCEVRFATADPVARLKSGDILETNTLDAFGNAIQKPTDTLRMVKGDNPLTGPFFVEGAEPGDTLVVKIL